MNITNIALVVISIVFFILYKKTRCNPIFPLLLVLIFVSEKQIEQSNVVYMNMAIETLKPMLNKTIKNNTHISNNDINTLLNDKKLYLKDVIIVDEEKNKSVILNVRYNKYFVEVSENYFIN